MKDYFDNLYKGTSDSFYEMLYDRLKNDKKTFVVTANPESYMISNRDLVMSEIMVHPKYTVVADGIGVIKACEKLGVSDVFKIPGVDIASNLLDYGNELHKTIYLFGSKKIVVKMMVDKIGKEYPSLEIVGYSDGYVENKDKVFKDIIEKQPDIVLVALGIPMQEKLIGKYFSQAKKGIYIGVGGSFDVISGYKKRAPKIFQKMNLEWLYRIVTEPSRLKRFYHNNIKFFLEIRKYNK